MKGFIFSCFHFHSCFNILSLIVVFLIFQWWISFMKLKSWQNMLSEAIQLYWSVAYHHLLLILCKLNLGCPVMALFIVLSSKGISMVLQALVSLSYQCWKLYIRDECYTVLILRESIFFKQFVHYNNMAEWQSNYTRYILNHTHHKNILS